MARVQIGRSGVIGIVAGLLVALAVAVFAGVSFSSSSRIETLTSGAPAPAWSGTSIGGIQLTSNAERGRWVVLNFFATWCDGCQQETPALEAFVAAHPAGVQVVSVLHADSDADARHFASSHAVTWPILSAGSGEAIAQHFKLADALPQTYVIAPDGRLAVQLAGAVTEAQLDRIIAGRGSL